MELANIYKVLKRVQLISWLMSAEPKGLNKTDWEARSHCGVWIGLCLVNQGLQVQFLAFP